jgi:hypothetical protein
MKVAQAETVLACVQEVLGSNVIRVNNIPRTIGTPRNFVAGVSTNSTEEMGQGSGGGSPLVRGSEAAVISHKKFHFIQ